MRLRYLDTDFFQEASRDATRKCAQSILHVCGLRLEDLPEQEQQQLNAGSISAILQEIGENPLPEEVGLLESQARIRDKLLKSLLPFKQARDESPQGPPQENADENDIAVLHLELVQILDEEELLLPQVWDSVAPVENLEQPLIEVLAVMREKLLRNLLPCKEELDENFQEQKKHDNVPVRNPFLNLDEPVIIRDLETYDELTWEPRKLAEVLDLKPRHINSPENLRVEDETLDDHRAEDELRDGQIETFEDLRAKEEVLRGKHEADFLRDVLLRKQDVPLFPEAGVLEALNGDDVMKFELPRMEVVMVSDDEQPLFWEPRSLAAALNVDPVEIACLDKSLTGSELFEKLVVGPQISLQCQFFKFLPIPTVVCNEEKQAPVEELVIGALTSVAKCSQPSATDFIYLDWHYSQGNDCNDQRCFFFRSHRLCVIPSRIAVQVEDEKLQPVEIPSEPVPASGFHTAEAYVTLEVTEDGHNISSRAGVGLADSFPNADYPENVPGVRPDDALRPEKFSGRSGTRLPDTFLHGDEHHRQVNVPGVGEKSSSRSRLPDAFLKGDEHRRQSNVSDRFTSRSVARVADASSFSDDHQHQKSVPGDRAGGILRQDKLSSRSGEKLAFENKFSGVALDDDLRQNGVDAADHHRRQNQHRPADNWRSPPVQTCTAIFVANISLVNKHGLTSRRSTYQKVLNLEKDGAQVIEREFRLPIDLVLSPTKCLVFYTADRLCLHGQAWSSEAVSASIVSIIDNEMKAISFGFQDCVMVFEGDRKFLSAVLEDVDNIYVAAVGLNIHAQCFVSSKPAETDSIVARCVNQAQQNVASTFPRMAESQTVAEAFLTQSPAINPLSAHAILSSGKSLSTFIAMTPEEQLQACKPFVLSKRSMELFKAQCGYGRAQRREPVRQAQRKERYEQSNKPAEQRPQQMSRETITELKTERSKRKELHQQTPENVLASKQMFTQRYEFEEAQAPAEMDEVQGPVQTGEGDGSLQPEKVDELSHPYFPPAAEFNEEWSPELNFSSAPYFPPAAQLDEDWDESPTVAQQPQFPTFDDDKENKTCDFGFSTNRRRSSSSSSVKDALKNWLSTRERNKKNVKRPEPVSYQQDSQRSPTPSSVLQPVQGSRQRSGFGRKKREVAKEEEGNTTSRKQQQQQQQQQNKKNDILSLWENFKCRKQSQIQASGSLLQTSKSFKRPSSSVFSSSSSSPPSSQQRQTHNNSLSSVQPQQPRGGKRPKRITL